MTMMIQHSYLDQLLYTHNGSLPHLYNTILQSCSMWDVEWLKTHMCILQKASKLGPSTSLNDQSQVTTHSAKYLLNVFVSNAFF